MDKDKPYRRWPLWLIASPAAVAVWSGWVGLGSLSGFGVIHPLPGIWPGLRINTAITLPVGVEAYGAYALGAWLVAHGVPDGARKFAKRSAIGALALGMLGQVAYHVLAAAHATRAPWPVVVLVSCLPVVTLGFGAALTHLLRREPEPGVALTEIEQETPLAKLISEASEARTLPDVPPARKSPSEIAPQGRKRPSRASAARRRYRRELEAGNLPSINRIRKEMRVGHPVAKALHAHLGEQLAET